MFAILHDCNSARVLSNKITADRICHDKVCLWPENEGWNIPITDRMLYNPLIIILFALIHQLEETFHVKYGCNK